MPIMPRFFSLVALAIFVEFGLITLPTSASDFANNVLSYVAGSNPANGFTNPLVALGPPERFTGEGIAPGAVTPFHPCFGANEIVSIGAGGQLTLGFDPPLRDQSNNPFGIDFIVFGNSFFTDAGFPAGVVGALAADGGIIQVTGDGVTWMTIPNTFADGLCPTMGWVDGGAYATTNGLIATDPNTPVDPAWTAALLVGKTYSELIEIYHGSAGGAGVDLASVGLTQAIAVRIMVPTGIHPNVEIDAVARVSASGNPADIDGDGLINGLDLATVLSAFGTASAAADIDHSGLVDGLDLTAILAGWST